MKTEAKNWGTTWLCAGLLGLGLPLAQAQSIGPLTGETDYQVPYAQAWSAFAGSFMADHADALAALAGAPSVGTLAASATGLRVQYIGTDSALDAVFAFGADASDASRQLFDTRAGCSYAQWQADPFCLVEQIGQVREITALGAGQLLSFSLSSSAQGGADGHLLDLGNGSWLLGLNDGSEGSSGSYTDVVLLLTPFDAATAVPEPASGLLGAAGLLLVFALQRRSRPSRL